MNLDASRSPSSGATWRKVRPNRRQWLLLLAQFYFIVQVFTIAPMLNAGEDFSLGRALSGAVCGAVPLMAVFAVVIRSTYFKYDLRSGRIEAPNRWGVRRSYPRLGYDRLEFSSVYGEIHEVGASGRRRRVPITALWADRTDWKAFVEGFHPSAGLPIVVRASQSHSEPARTAQPPEQEGRNEIR